MRNIFFVQWSRLLATDLDFPVIIFGDKPVAGDESKREKFYMCATVQQLRKMHVRFGSPEPTGYIGVAVA